MFKQLLFIIILTAAAVFFMKEFTSILYTLGNAQTFLVNELAAFFPKETVYRYISKSIILIVIPILISLLIALVYWLVKHREMPKLTGLIWLLWVISLLIFVLQK
ncbi:MAG: hypothetical protein AMJ43_00795 [Coxiella sp. DG_40]|nr:MAG: hypothetical protein AMJ43_00795 [Coxiella sp. DG_40]